MGFKIPIDAANNILEKNNKKTDIKKTHLFFITATNFNETSMA